MENMAGYLAISFSHKNTEITMREKLAFDSNEMLKIFLQAIKSQIPSLEEIILLSTCNRVEIYIYGDDLENTKDILIKLLAQTKNIPPVGLETIADIYTHQDAIHHVFCVASSLNSIVVGETQIAGQLKSAYKFCFDNGFCGKNLTRLIHFAFRCAAQVRNSTQISQNAVSIASVAVKEANHIVEKHQLKQKVAIVVGLGEMGTLSAKHLLACGYKIILVNRNRQKANELALELTKEYAQIEDLKPIIEVRDFENLSALINEYPLLFTSTSSPTPIVLKSMIQESSFQRFWFDLAVPRDIQTFEDEKILVYDVDSLQQVVCENIANRQRNAAKAYEVIGNYTIEFSRWLQTLGVDPLIKKIRDLAREASLKELQKAIKKGFLPKEYEDSVTKILHGAFNTFLHQPTIAIKNLSDKQEADPIIEALKSVFGIDDDVMLINRYKCEYDTTLS